MQYYFKRRVQDDTLVLACVKKYGPPDFDLLRASSQCVWSCRREEALLVINARAIVSVVAMVPHTQPGGQLGAYSGQVFVVEKMGLDVAPLTGGC